MGTFYTVPTFLSSFFSSLFGRFLPNVAQSQIGLAPLERRPTPWRERCATLVAQGPLRSAGGGAPDGAPWVRPGGARAAPGSRGATASRPRLFPITYWS